MSKKAFLIIEFLIFSALAFLAILGILYLAGGHLIEYQAPPVKEIQNPVKLIYREVTAYTASIDETDSTPCEGALPGINFCDPPFPILATNELPLGSKVEIDEIEYLVADRTNSKYQKTYDILMTTKTEALEFGRQIKPIIIN